MKERSATGGEVKDMPDLDALKQKYAPVIEEIKNFEDLGAKVDELRLEGQKLYLRASVPSNVVANRVWDVIKATNPTYSDLHHEMATAGGLTQSYTIKPGDSLCKIAQRFYGDPRKYSAIADANNIDDPNKIQVGQELTLPLLS
jgi:nucleoid-associated protein YgaU